MLSPLTSIFSKRGKVTLKLLVQKFFISLRIFSHFEKSKLSKEQVLWFENHDVPLELRAFGGKKSEARPKAVPTYVELIELKGERKAIKTNNSSTKLTPKIVLEVSEHISR